MFANMRRHKQSLPKEECITILQNGTSGTLALLGHNDYPYAVPMSYVYDNDKIYFHCAKSGHKIDAIKKHQKASFCVIDQDIIVPEKYTTYFKSVIVFETIKILNDETKIRESITTLTKKYVPNDDEGIQKEIDREFPLLCILELSIEHMSGKQAIELVKNTKS